MTRAAPWLCAGLHVLGLAALALVLKDGTGLEADVYRRAQYIAKNTAVWRAGWAIWMVAALSLVGFYTWWATRLPRNGWRAAGVLFAAAGMACDLAGEGIFMSVLVERAVQGDFPGLSEAQRQGILLTAGAANALYTIGGVILTLQTADLPRWVGRAMWATWLAGAAMTVCALLDRVTGLVVSSAVLFPLLIAWTVWMALFWRRA